MLRESSVPALVSIREGIVVLEGGEKSEKPHRGES